MTSSQNTVTSPSLGLFGATMIGIGAMIGAGIFVLTGLAAETAGPAALLVFLLNGGVTTFTALSYAELASAIPESGGGFAYVKEGFPDGVAFIVGWMFWSAYMIAGALYALGFGSNFLELLHLLGLELPASIAVSGLTAPVGPVLLALVVVLTFGTLNALSTSASGSAETIVTLAKILVLLLFVAFGAASASTSEFAPLFSEGQWSMLPAMGATFVAFQGYDLITTVTEEVQNPRKNVPRAILLSLVATLIVYLLVVFVAIGTLGADRLGAAGETAIAQASESFMPALPLVGSGARLIAIGAVLSTVSALNAVIIASSRVAFSMGREGLLPRWFGQRSAALNTPFAAVVVSGLIMITATAVAPLQQAGNLASLFFLLSFIVVNASAVQIRRRKPNLARPFEMPLYPLTPALGIGLNLLLGLYIDPQVWIIGGAWLAVGAIIYVAYIGLLRDLSLREVLTPFRTDPHTVDVDRIRRDIASEIAEQQVEIDKHRELQSALNEALDIATASEFDASTDVGIDTAEEKELMERLADETESTEDDV